MDILDIAIARRSSGGGGESSTLLSAIQDTEGAQPRLVPQNGAVLPFN